MEVSKHTTVVDFFSASHSRGGIGLTGIADSITAVRSPPLPPLFDHSHPQTQLLENIRTTGYTDERTYRTGSQRPYVECLAGIRLCF